MVWKNYIIWDDDRLSQLKKMKLERKTHSEIGLKFKCSRHAVSGAVRRHILIPKREKTTQT